MLVKPNIFTAIALVAFVTLNHGATALEPSFDCAKAQSGAEDAVCSSDALAALDIELARLFTAASTGPNMDPDALATLRTMQRGWIKGRDACWTSDMGVPLCTANEYAFRISELRQHYADARAEEGASLGPFPYRCEGLETTLSAVFVNTLEPVVVLRWGENAVVLPQVEAASGAKYASDAWYGGPALFWTRGREAQFAAPGADALSCQQDDIG